MYNVKSEFVSYDEVINIIGKNKIEERISAIVKIYDEIFLKETELEDGNEIRLNYRTVTHIVLDYFTDIIRLKDFHGIDRVNYDKIIAYECSWLLKRKPIQVLLDDREDLVYINEKFVLEVFIHHLLNDNVTEILRGSLLWVFCDTIFYHFKYRNCDARILEMFIMCFKAGNSLDTISYK